MTGAPLLCFHLQGEADAAFWVSGLEKRLFDEKITVSVIPCNLLHKVVADVLISTESFGSSPYQRCLSDRPSAQMDLR